MIAGMIEFEIGGLVRGTHAGGSNQYDAINVGGQANLDGTMDVNLINGFTAMEGDSFQLVNAMSGIFGTVTPDFFDFTNAGLTSGLKWDTNTFLNNGTIFVVSSVPEPTSFAMFRIACSFMALRRRTNSASSI